MPRLFVALDPPADVRTTLADFRAAPGSGPEQALDGARWTRPEQLHLTLRFLGDTPAERLADLTAALAAVSAPPLDLLLDGLTAFPSPRRPRVLAVRVRENEALTALQAQIEAAVQRLGFAPEDRPFRPHVTLARLKRPDARAVQGYLQSHEIDTAFAADAFHLYASTLTPSGAVHERLASFALRP